MEEAPSSDAASACVRKPPQLVLLNVVAADCHAGDAAKAIRSSLPAIPIVALVDPACERGLPHILGNTTRNLFSTTEPPERLLAAIHTVASGGTYRSPCFQAAEKGADGVEAIPGSPSLTPREIEILLLIAQGLSKRRVAEAVHLSVKTVDNHCTSIMAKLNVHNRVDLARYAIRAGLSEP